MGPQEADGQPHDGGLVQVGAHTVWQGQFMSQLIEDLRLLAAPASCRIPGLFLPPLRAAPKSRDKELVLHRCCQAITVYIPLIKTWLWLSQTTGSQARPLNQSRLKVGGEGRGRERHSPRKLAGVKRVYNLLDTAGLAFMCSGVFSTTL